MREKLVAGNGKSVTDQVYENLLQMVLQGKFSVDEKLPSENELSKLFDVSRNTVRAALNRMSVLGIIETQRGGGSYLKGFGTNIYLNTIIPSTLSFTDDLLGLMMFRRGVEVTSARLAAINADARDIKNLEEYFEFLKKGGIDNQDFAQSTSDFHLRIAQASKSSLLVSILEVIKWVITAKMADFLVYKPDVADSSYYHHMIFQCIRKGKPEEAAFMMDRHMELLIARVEDYLRYAKTHPQEAREGEKLRRPVTHIYDRKEDG